VCSSGCVGPGSGGALKGAAAVAMCREEFERAAGLIVFRLRD
jgi:hypothetical protein